MKNISDKMKILILLLASPFLLFGAWFLSVYVPFLYYGDSRPLTNFYIVAYLVGMLAFIISPFITTFLITIRTVKKQANKPQTDHLTYIDQNLLNEFSASQSLHDILSKDVVDAIQENDVTEEKEAGMAEETAEYSLEELKDIPEYDPAGPDPFQKG